jgi:hypothetical protein
MIVGLTVDSRTVGHCLDHEWLTGRTDRADVMCGGHRAEEEAAINSGAPRRS